MKRCAYISMDEYQCQEEGIEKGIEEVGTILYCEGHAKDVRDENDLDDMFGDELVCLDTHIPDRYSDDFDPIEY